MQTPEHTFGPGHALARAVWRSALSSSGSLAPALALLLAAGCAPRHVQRLPRDCWPGTVVITGTHCQSRCTCQADNKWRCTSQPCMRREHKIARRVPPPQRPRLTPAQLAALQARHAATLRRRHCPPLPCPPQALEQLSRQSDGTITSRCLPHAKGPHRSKRLRQCHQDGSWRDVRSEASSPWQVIRRFAAGGKLLHTDYWRGGHPALTCRMTGSNHARCTPSISAIYLRSRCWPSGRILPDELTFITSPIAFSRRFHCKRPSTTINWKRTVLVLVRQSVGRDEELLLSVLKSPSKTELVATIKRRCVAASTHQRRTRSQHRYLLVLPRTHTTLNARVHRDKGACPPAR